MVAVRLLGPFEVDVAGKPVDLGGPRQRAVLALLLVARGDVVSVDRLIDDLWRGEPPPRATGALQAYVSHLRRVLEPDRAPRRPAQVLVSAAPGYRVVLGTDQVDAWRFEAMVDEGATSGAARTELDLLRAALGLWRGAALAEFAAEPWAAPEAARLDELRLLARERFVDARIRCGEYEAAAIDAEAQIRDAPLREQGWALLATAQYASGRQGEALSSLRRARELLADELGIDPGPRLLELEDAVRQQALTLPAAPSRPARSMPPGPTATLRSGFVGRRVELDTLLAAMDEARPGAPAVALVAGDAGAGKSALLAQLRDDRLARGWRVVAGRCPEGDGGSPAWAWTEALRSLAAEVPPGRHADALAPLLSDAAAAPRDVLQDRFRLHRATGQWLSELTDRPLLVLLDDVHRADSETRSLLASLLEQAPTSRIAFAAAYRPETGEALDDLLARLAPYAPARVRLSGLAPDESADLIASVTGAAPDPAVIAALAERTDGNPFYLLESARLLASEGELVATSQVPQGVADVLRRRFARLPEESVSLLRLAAVIGRDVDVALLERSAETDADTVLTALEAGVISGLLVEPAPGTVRFSHLLVRETLYSGIPQLRRSRWHARVAAAVAELYPSDLSALAHHALQAATPATAQNAAQHAVAAAQLAESRFTWDAAAELYRRAVRCLELDPTTTAATWVDLLAALVRALIYGGSTVEAREVHSRAVHVALTSGDDDLAVQALISWNIPTPWQTRSYQSFDEVLVGAIERQLARSNLDTETRIRLLCLLVREVSSIDDPRGDTAAEDAVRLAREHGDRQLLALALVAQADVVYPDLYPERRETMRTELMQLAEGRDDMVFYEVLGRVWTVQHAALRLDIGRVRTNIAAAAQLASRYQLSQTRFVVSMMEAMLAHLQGDPARAGELYTEAHRINRRLGAVNADGIWALAMLTVAFTSGQLGALEPQLKELYANYGATGIDAYALALVERGAMDEARRIAVGQAEYPRDFFFVLLNSMRGLVRAKLGDADAAARIYADLLPHADEVAGCGTAAYALAPVALVLGRLAAVLDNASAARAHFTQAAEVARRCGSPQWAAMAEADLAALG